MSFEIIFNTQIYGGFSMKFSFKKLNRRIVAVVIVTSILLSGAGGAVAFKYVKAGSDGDSGILTTTVTTTSIEKTLSATGTLISSEESGQFATTTSSYPVEEVYVKVGDIVKKGDALYKLDMSSMEETLAYQQEALSIQNQQNQISSDNAAKAVEDAKQTGAIQVNEANRAVEEAKQTQTAASRTQSEKNTELDRAKSAESEAKSALDSANAAVTSAENAVNTAQSALDAAKKGTTDDEGNTVVDQTAVDKATKDLETAQANLVSAKADRDTKKTAYSTAVSERESAEQAVQSAADSLASANRSLASSQASAENTQNSANNTIISDVQTQKSTELSNKASTLSAEQEIAKSKEELSKAVVYATQDGTVTNVNVVAGQTYSGTEAVIIDNVTNLKASTDIDEANIAKIKEGMVVRIKTDSTGDEVLTGTVTFVSPTATKNSSKTSDDSTSSTASVSKSRATYRVDVTLDCDNEDLRLGMTAKMTFVLDSKENILAVPTSDIQTNDDGNNYVVVQKTDGSTTNVVVTTGLSDDYYTEVSGDIKDGDIIVESSDSGDVDSTLESMGSDGGIYIE